MITPSSYRRLTITPEPQPVFLVRPGVKSVRHIATTLAVRLDNGPQICRHHRHYTSAQCKVTLFYTISCPHQPPQRLAAGSRPLYPC